MKTPQQIKNEVEKGCGKKCEGCLEGHGYGKLFKCGEHYGFAGIDDYGFELCPSCQAKLSILTEYDKSIKEMIESFRKEIKELDREEFYNEDCFKRVLFKIDNILSKIGDGSQ